MFQKGKLIVSNKATRYGTNCCSTKQKQLSILCLYDFKVKNFANELTGKRHLYYNASLDKEIFRTLEIFPLMF